MPCTDDCDCDQSRHWTFGRCRHCRQVRYDGARSGNFKPDAYDFQRERCEACALGDIDLTTTAFSAIADINSGQSANRHPPGPATHTYLYKGESMASSGHSTQWVVVLHHRARRQALRPLHQRQRLPPQPKVCVSFPISCAMIDQVLRSHHFNIDHRCAHDDFCGIRRRLLRSRRLVLLSRIYWRDDGYLW